MVELAIEHMVRLTRSQVIVDLQREVTFTKKIAGVDRQPIRISLCFSAS